jgi:hypothetical protein
MTTAFARMLPRALFTAALAATALPALAASGSYAVTLSTPLAEARREIIDGAIWRCEGDRCTAPADGARAQAVCGNVARRIGPVARFASPKGELNAEQLARCNAN